MSMNDANFDGFPQLPNVPQDMPDIPGEGSASSRAAEDDDEIDFDDLARRFEELTKKK